jgi:Chaperone of endosialidase
VSNDGNVGLGTATPVLDLSIRTGNTPAHRLEQDASGGFTAQTWDIAGNEANFFVRDVTGGSRLPFRIRPGAPTSSIDISATGNVGIGTASPDFKLDVEASDAALRINATGANQVSRLLLTSATRDWRIGNDPNFANQLFIFDGTASAVRMAFDTSGNVGIGTMAPAARLHTTGSVRFAGVTSCSSGIVSNANGDLSCLASSRQFKNIAGDLAPGVALDNVMALRPQTGSYTETADEPEHWLIAEEVAAVDPALVGRRDGEPYTVKTHGIVADLVAVIQQQQRRIEALERAIAR